MEGEKAHQGLEKSMPQVLYQAERLQRCSHISEQYTELNLSAQFRVLWEGLGEASDQGGQGNQQRPTNMDSDLFPDGDMFSYAI